MRSSLILLLLLTATGCTRSTLKESVADKHGDQEAALDFWDELAKERAVCNQDAIHALMLTIHKDAELGNYDAQLDVARKRGWVSKTKELPPKQTAAVGLIAKAVVIETGIKGGLTMRVFGPSRRYAVWELNDKGWLANQSSDHVISGLELIALLSKVEEYKS